MARILQLEGVNSSSSFSLTSSGQVSIGPSTSHSIVLNTNSISRFAITSDGKILIGSSNKYTNNVGTSTGYEQNLQVDVNSWTGNTALINWTSTSGAGPFGTLLFLSRSKSGIVGTHTILSDGDAIGRIVFNGSDGTAFQSAADISVYVDGTPGSNDMPGRIVFSTSTDGTRTPTERMRITSTGAISFGSSGTAYGASGQVLTSAGDSSPTWTTATNANTASAIVQRDASGNFSAGTITGSLSGTATTATQLINGSRQLVAGGSTWIAWDARSAVVGTSGLRLLDSAGTWEATFYGDGTSQGFLNAAGSWVVQWNNGTLTTGSVPNARTTATNANTASAIVARDASGNFSAGTITATLTGNSTGLSNGTFNTDISTSTYGSWRVTGSKGGYVGTEYSLSTNLNTLMFDSSGNGGLYNYQDWLYYFLKSHRCLGIMTSSTSSSYSLYVGGVTGGIYATGNITAYSDERVKNNWASLSSDFIERLSKVKSGTYSRIDKEGLRQVGVSAQSLREVIPEAVTEDKDNDNKLGVSYGNAALAACVELAKEIVSLKKEIELLKNNK